MVDLLSSTCGKWYSKFKQKKNKSPQSIGKRLISKWKVLFPWRFLAIKKLQWYSDIYNMKFTSLNFPNIYVIRFFGFIIFGMNWVYIAFEFPILYFNNKCEMDGLGGVK